MAFGKHAAQPQSVCFGIVITAVCNMKCIDRQCVRIRVGKGDINGDFFFFPVNSGRASHGQYAFCTCNTRRVLNILQNILINLAVRP